MKNYYEILKISRYSTQDDIKKAYLKLIKKYHPDVYSGDKLFAEKQTALITEAYTTLKNPELKAKYDRKTFGANTTTQQFNQSQKTYSQAKTQSTSQTNNESQKSEPSILEKIKTSCKKFNQKIKDKFFNFKQKRNQKKQEKLKTKQQENSQNAEQKENSTNESEAKIKDPAKKQRLILDLAIGALLILLFLLLFFPLK